MIALRNVLIATDFSETSEAALRYARGLAEQFGATLHLLHVVENVMARFGADAYPVVVPGLQKDIEEAARKRLDASLDPSNVPKDRAALPTKLVLRTANGPAAAIVAYAEEAGIDLIVMGTHGRGALAHALMGSVAERVVRTAPCPVLTVRHAGRDFVLPDALVAVARTAEQGVSKAASTAARVAF